MTVDETRAYLEQPAAINKKINALLLAKTETKALLTRCTARYEGIGGNSGGYRSHIDDTISKIIDLETQIAAEIDSLVDKKTEILANIMRISDQKHQAVLIHRYINCKTVEQIAEIMNYSATAVKKKIKAAIAELSKIL